MFDLYFHSCVDEEFLTCLRSDNGDLKLSSSRRAQTGVDLECVFTVVHKLVVVHLFLKILLKKSNV